HYARLRSLPAGGGDPVALPRAVGLWLCYTGEEEFQTARALGAHLLALAERVDEPILRGDGCWVAPEPRGWAERGRGGGNPV
ncbi:MAG TPA: hypothetical protein VIM84_09695, partial [Gemmatimonadales bacterium]